MSTAFQVSQDLSNETVSETDRSYLVDRIIPGELLVISFGFVSWNDPAGFDFFGRLKKIEALTGRPLNKILLRDVTNGWYHRGVPGLGLSVDEVADSLAVIVRDIRPSRVVTLGQSMGGYAAVLFGHLLDADQAVAFCPLSFLNTKEALLYHDRRWLSVMEDLEKNPPLVRYFDLAALGRRKPGRIVTDVIFGTKPDQANCVESVNLDAFHAQRLAQIPNCRLHPIPEADHVVVKYLSDNGLMDDLLLDLLQLTRSGR